MLSKMMFRFSGEEKRIQILKAKGIIIGTRLRNERRVYLYLLQDFFVEVMYQHDDIDMMPERIETFSSLGHLNSYLESDFRAAF